MFSDDGFSVEKTANPDDVAGNHVSFYKRPVLNEIKSWGQRIEIQLPTGQTEVKVVEGAGREIYDEVEYITILSPGDPTNIIDRPVSDTDRKRYPQRYAAFKAGQSQEAMSGTPLSSVPWMPANLAAEAKHQHIHSVEQLAAVSDEIVGRLGMGWHKLRQKARDFIEAAKGNAPIEAYRTALEQEQAKRKQLEDQLSKLAEQMDRLDKRKGRQSAEG